MKLCSHDFKISPNGSYRFHYGWQNSHCRVYGKRSNFSIYAFRNPAVALPYFIIAIKIVKNITLIHNLGNLARHFLESSPAALLNLRGVIKGSKKATKIYENWSKLSLFSKIHPRRYQTLIMVLKVVENSRT